MKALVLSDIHSNICALYAILAVEKDYDCILCAGDLVDFGPFPQQVLAWCRSQPALTCVQGNHDQGVLRSVCELRERPERLSEAEYTWSLHNASCLGEAAIAYLAALPETANFVMDGYEYLVQHRYGEGYATVDSLEEFEAFFAAKSVLKTDLPRRILFGHTHRQCVHVLADDCLWLNPGSISYRHKGDAGTDAHYMTITDGQIALKRLEYDTTPLPLAASRSPLKADLVAKSYRRWDPKPDALPAAAGLT